GAAGHLRRRRDRPDLHRRRRRARPRRRGDGRHLHRPEIVSERGEELMFRRLAASINPDPAVSGPQVFDFHPMQLARYLDAHWANRVATNVLPSPDLLEVPSALRNVEATSFITPALPPSVIWDQLIYAYMVENTRAYEIFARVLQEFLYGERLGTPSNATHH